MKEIVIVLITFMAFVESAKFYNKDGSWSNRARKFGRKQDVTENCPCALSALAQMDRILRKHHADSVTKPINTLMGALERVAKACTVQEECRCPEGYMKTADGFSCLLIADEKVVCNDASKICEEEFDGRLAVAKDQESLDKLARFIDDVRPDNDEFYWIGLSYNTTIGDSPLWRWEDGSKVEYEVTEKLNKTSENVKKSLINFSGEDLTPIERVAINKNFKGSHWKQEVCGTNYRNNNLAKHKYICEYIMFKIEVLSEL